MMSDHDNDEIKDSSFPVEFGDNESLDMYGVWVKSGPRDASPAVESLSSGSAAEIKADIEDLAESNVGEIEDIADLADFEELPDLPDFDDLGDEKAIEPSVQSSSAINEIEDHDITFVESMPETVVQPIEQLLDVEDFDTVEAFSAVEDTYSTAEGSGIVDSGDIGGQILDIDFPEDDNVEMSATNDILQAIDEKPIRMDTEPEAVVETVSDMVEEIVPEPLEEDFESFAALGEMDIPLPDDSIPDISEFEIPADVKASSDEIPSVMSKELPADDDFSEFLDGLNTESPPAKSGSTDDFDLDSFVNEFNETGGTPEAEKDKIFDDTDPVDIDLEFDESFIKDSEKIRATGATVSESEFYNSEFGVELVDETSMSIDDEFSDDFGTEKQDIFTVSDKVSHDSGSVRLDQTEGLESATEFDDLLASLDDSPVTTAPKGMPKAVQTVKTFNLNVTEEDDLEAVSRTETENTSDDELSVPLSGLQNAAVTTDNPKENKTYEEDLETLKPENDTTIERKDDSTIDLSSFGEFMAAQDETRPESIVESSIPEDLLELSPQNMEEELDIQDDSTVQDILSATEAKARTEEKLDIPEIKDYNVALTEPDKFDLNDTAMEESVSLDFDDISAVEKELSEDIPEMGEGKVVSNDKSTELLMIIADELSSIKKEISTLKNELSSFKGSSITPDTAEGTELKPAENSGFFSDDDTDETIALTGDELNNILITADFTEEKNDEAAGEDLPSSNETVDLTSEFLPESAVEQEEESVPETMLKEVDFSEPEIPETLPESLFEMPDLDANTDVEVSHVNKLEEDISYLDGTESIEPDLDDVAIDVPDLEVIDFNDEKLEEPELTEFNIDLSDIEKDFPAEQEINVIQDAEAVEELTETVVEPVEVDAVESFDEAETVVDMTPDIAPEPEETVEAAIQPRDSANRESTTVVTGESGITALPVELKDEIKSVLTYMDQLLESLPEEKIEEFARSEHFEVYKKLFEELGIS